MPGSLLDEDTIANKLRTKLRSPLYVRSNGRVFWRSPLRPKPETTTARHNPTKRAVDCCIQERERWRQQQRARGLIYSSRSTPSRPPPASQLDSRSTTPRSFLDLPPELRNTIYHYYFLARATHPERLTHFLLPVPHPSNPNPPDFPYKPTPPHDPPLCLVSPQLRHETHGIFLRTHRFPLVIHLEPGPARNSCSVVPWYRHLDPARLRQIRHLEVYYCLEKADRRLNHEHLPDALTFAIDLDETRNTYAVVATSRRFALGPYGRALLDETRCGMHVQQTMRETLATRGVGELTWEDFEAFVLRP